MAEAPDSRSEGALANSQTSRRGPAGGEDACPFAGIGALLRGALRGPGAPRVEGFCIHGARPIDEGGQGSVWRATRLFDGRAVALKRYAPPRTATALEAEVEVLRDVAHPALVRHLEVAVDERSEALLVMDFVPGPSLEAVVRERGPLPPRRALEVAEAVGGALAILHERGLVHRDVKPRNVILRDGRDPVLVDLGVVRDLAAPATMAAGARVGTPCYLAPEQAANPAAAGPEADVFSLGCTLLFTLTGAHPEAHPDGRATLRAAAAHLQRKVAGAEVSWTMERLLLRCLAFDPRLRCPDGRAFLEAVEGAVGSAGDARRSDLGLRYPGAWHLRDLARLLAVGVLAMVLPALLARLCFPDLLRHRGVVEWIWAEAPPGEEALRSAAWILWALGGALVLLSYAALRRGARPLSHALCEHLIEAGAREPTGEARRRLLRGALRAAEVARADEEGTQEAALLRARALHALGDRGKARVALAPGLDAARPRGEAAALAVALHLEEAQATAEGPAALPRGDAAARRLAREIVARLEGAWEAGEASAEEVLRGTQWALALDEEAPGALATRALALAAAGHEEAARRAAAAARADAPAARDAARGAPRRSLVARVSRWRRWGLSQQVRAAAHVSLVLVSFFLSCAGVVFLERVFLLGFPWSLSSLAYDDPSCVGLLFESPGALVAAVVSGSSTARAGLRPGDRLLALDGEPLTSAWSACTLARRLAVGVPVAFAFERAGERHEASVSPRALDATLEAARRHAIRDLAMRALARGDLERTLAWLRATGHAEDLDLVGEILASVEAEAPDDPSRWRALADRLAAPEE